MDDLIGDQRSNIDTCENGGDCDDDIMPALCMADGENLVGEVSPTLATRRGAIKTVVCVGRGALAVREIQMNNEDASFKVTDVCLKSSPCRRRYGIVGLRAWRRNLHSVP